MNLRYKISVAIGLFACIAVAVPCKVSAVSMHSSPAFFNNTIYIGADDGQLYAYDRANLSQPKWTFLTQGAIVSSPAIATDGTIYFGSRDGYIYAINPNGTQKWKFLTGHSTDSSPAIGSDGTVYIGSQDSSSYSYLYAIYPNGTQKWRYRVGQYVSMDSSPVIGSDGSILFLAGAYPAYLYALNPNDGNLMWTKSPGGSPSNPRVSPTIGPDGTIYVPILGGNGGIEGGLGAFYPNGDYKWSRLFGQYSAFQYMRSSATIGPDGTVFCAGEADEGTYSLYAFYPSGELRWRYSPSPNYQTSDSAPCIANDGTAFIGFNGLYWIDANGQKQWYWPDGPWIYSSPSLFEGVDGKVICAVGSSESLAIVTVNGMALQTQRSWSMFRGNQRNTANFADAYPPPASLAIDRHYVTCSGAVVSWLAITVAANVPWTATANQSWISIASGSSGAGNGTVIFNVAANGGAVRSGTITVSGGGITRTFTVNQWPVSATPGVSAEGDIDGDGAADLSVFHPATGNWHVLFNSGARWILPLGWSATVPVPADYNGDGMLDFAVYHPATGNWHIHESGAVQTRIVQFGWSATVPLPGDYDGDGKADLAVFHQASGRWYFLCTTAGRYSVQWGWSTTIPVPADYDGDGATDIGVYHPASGNWDILPSSFPAIGPIQKQWGWNEGIPVPSDYDGDGKADIAVFHRATGNWYIWGRGRPVNWGWSEVTPVPADYDGDGVTDIGVYHPASGNWYISKSSDRRMLQKQWGWSAAKPTLLYPLIHSWFGLP